MTRYAPQLEAKEQQAYEAAVARGRTQEIYLTKAMGAILGQDVVAAAEFVRLLVGPSTGENVVPSGLICRAEDPIDVMSTASLRASRSADLFFCTESGSDAFVIEAKLNAPLGPGQLEDYLSAPLKAFRQPVDRSTRLRVLLVCNRALALKPRDPHSRYLGARVWQEILGPLRDLPFESASRAARWRRVIDCYRTRKGFGGGPQVHLLPRDALDRSLDTLRSDLERALRRSASRSACVEVQPLAGHFAVRWRRSGARAELIVRQGGRRGPVRVTLDLAHPAGGDPILTIERTGGGRPDARHRGRIQKSYPKFLTEAGARLHWLVQDAELL